MRTIEWDDGVVKMIDQRRLPGELVIVQFTDYREVARAIKEMYIRGAPAIGAAATFGWALCAQESEAKTCAELRADLENAAATLQKTRPTAVNLPWALERMLEVARKAQYTQAVSPVGPNYRAVDVPTLVRYANRMKDKSLGSRLGYLLESLGYPA